MSISKLVALLPSFPSNICLIPCSFQWVFRISWFHYLGFGRDHWASYSMSFEMQEFHIVSNQILWLKISNKCDPLRAIIVLVDQLVQKGVYTTFHRISKIYLISWFIYFKLIRAYQMSLSNHFLFSHSSIKCIIIKIVYLYWTFSDCA